MFPKDFDRNRLGSCMSAAALATDYLLSKGMTDFKIIEGWVSFGDDWDLEKHIGKFVEYGNIFSHTWIEFPNGRKFDPTRKQWKEWGFNPDEAEFHPQVKKEYNPQQYQRVCKRQPLNETMSFNDLLKATDDGGGRAERSAQVAPRSLPVSLEDDNEVWNFRYKSNPSVTGKPYQGSIKFFKELQDRDSENAADLPCKVDCGCPDFMYRFAYNDAAKDASEVGPNTLNKNNGQKPQPAYDYGEGLCKHLTALAGYLRTKIQATQKSNLFEAMSDVAQTNRNFNVEYYD